MNPSTSEGAGSQTPAPAPGTDIATLARMFETTNYTFGVTTNGVDEAGSLRSPAPGGNCMNWIVGHLLVSRNALLAHLGQEPVGDAARLERYRRGSDPVRDGEATIPWEELTRDFATAQDRIRVGLRAVTPDALARPLPSDRNPFDVDSVGQMLSILNFHESYHLGQLGLLRRLIGMEGAIR